MKSTINFLRDQKLIASSMKCKQCQSKEMKLVEYTKSKDGEVWKCRQFKSTSSNRKGSFFYKCRTELTTSLLNMYLWSASIQVFQAEGLLLKINRNTVYDYFTFCRNSTVKRFYPIIFG